MKHLKTYLSVCLFFVSSYSYAGELSFNDALISLYGSHESISQADYDMKQKDYERKAALGLYSPRFSINGIYTYFGHDLNMDVDMKPVKDGINHAIGGLPLPPGFPPLHPELITGKIPDTMTQTVQQEQFFSLNATMLWPLFTGGKIFAANQAAKANYDISKSEIIAKHNELGSSMAEKYFTLRFAQDVVALKQEVRDSMEKHYNRALKLEKAGMLAKVERLHAEMSLKNAENSLEQSKRDIKLANSALKSMINYSEDNLIPSTPLFIIEEGSIEELTYFQDMAVTSNPRLKQLDSAKGLAKAGVTNSRSSFMPKVNVFGMASIYDYQLSTLAPDLMIGVQMSINVFDGLQNVHKYKASKATEESVKLKHIRTEKDIKTLIEQQYISLENARADYKAAESNLAFTEEYLRARQKAFAQGMATSLDVVDAELALSNAKLTAITAAYKFDIALIKILELSGNFDSFETYRARASIEPAL